MNSSGITSGVMLPSNVTVTCIPH